MDLQEWELLPDEGYLEIQDDAEGKNKIYSRKNEYPATGTVFQMNYFDIRAPAPKISPPCIPSPQYKSVLDRVVRVPIVLEPEDDQPNLIQKGPIKISSIENNPDPDPVSQVFFKKMMEIEFVDIKVESPKSNGGGRGFVQPQIEGSGAFHFKEEEPRKGGGEPEAAMMMMIVNKDKKAEEVCDAGEEEGGSTGLNNIWKWSLSGIGAICSFGMAAATVCIIVFNSSQRKSIHHQKLQFQIYTSDKRMKQVVQQSAIAAATRAHITVGGYYDYPPSLSTC